MNVKLKEIIARIETWPEPMREQAAELLLWIEQEHAMPYQLSEEEKAAIDRGLDDARHGRFATAEEVEAVFAKYRHRSSDSR